MARLSEGGQLALGVGDGAVSVGTTQIDRGGEACWLNRQVVLYQKLTEVAATVAAYDVSTGIYAHVDDQGANFLRAGGGSWAAFSQPGIRTSWGLVLDTFRLCDVSDRGDVLVCPHMQNEIHVYPPNASQPSRTLATGPLGQDATAGINVRLRDGLLLYQSVGVWALYDCDMNEWVTITPRTDYVDYAVPVRINEEAWLLERAAGRLSLRPANSTEGYVVASGDTWSPDAVPGTSADEIIVGWARIQGEPLHSGLTVPQSLSDEREDLNLIDPPVIVEPVIPSYDRFVYTGPIDASAERPDYGYHAAPGNCEVIVRDADLSKRKRPNLPLVAVWQVAQDVPREQLLGVWFGVSGDGSYDAEELELARVVADEKDRPVVVYYDGQQPPPSSVLALKRPGDGLGINGYPRFGERLEETITRVAQTAHTFKPMMFVRPLYTQQDHWDLQGVLDLQVPYTELTGSWDYIKIDAWFCCAPPARKGMLAHPELWRVGEGLESAVAGQPEIEDKMAAYGQPLTGFLGGTLESHPQGANFRAVRMANGKILCCTPQGKLEERDNKGGWEAFELSANGSSLIAHRDDNGTAKVYVLPWV